MNIPVERPAETAGALYYPTPVTPEEAFQAIGRLRKDARDEIDRLIRFLDDTDNHMELEDSADDNPQSDDSELEPSLGFLESNPNICAGLGDDLEDEHDGAEDDREGDSNENDEPSFGWGIDGEQGNISGADRELQDHRTVRPQRRTRLGKGVHAAPNYCRGNRILGLSAAQQAAMRAKQ